MRLRDDAGSLLPLVIGYGALTAVLMITTIDLASLNVAQRGLDAIAEAAALAAADTFTLRVTDGEPRAVLTAPAVAAGAALLLEATPGEAVLVESDTPDGSSAVVTVQTTWHPPLFSIVVPDGVTLRSTAIARTAIG
ncbi:hypothetical protein [Microbacterium sp. ZW T5_56]|uniref:hypothetical protein n=1 Tax=Microbacterium sp. ZW T5_56 TaxID=3378081 RepID=UPI003854736B